MDRKNNCSDCHQCGVCSETRCRLCKDGDKKRKCYASMDEQIQKFEQVNRAHR